MPSLVRKPVPARPQPPTAPPPQQRGAGGRPVPVITPDTSQVMPVGGLFWREGLGTRQECLLVQDTPNTSQLMHVFPRVQVVTKAARGVSHSNRGVWYGLGGLGVGRGECGNARQQPAPQALTPGQGGQ